MDFKITHFLLFVVAAFLLYHLMGGCANGVIDGFSVGGQIRSLSTKCSSPDVSRTSCARQGTLSNNQQFISNQFNNLTLNYETISGELQDIKDRLNRMPLCKEE